MTTRSTIRVLLVDDFSIVRGGLRYFLSATDDIVVVGEASSGADALALIGDLQPDIVLMDLMMPDMDGVTTIKHVRERFPKVRVLALTSYGDGDRVQQALAAGAAGYLLKDADGRDLASAIRMVCAGRHAIAPEVAKALATTASQPRKPGSDLSERELDVLHLLTSGRSNEAIAAELCISRNTVRHHVQNILGKLGVVNRTEAAAVAIQYGLGC